MCVEDPKFVVTRRSMFHLAAVWFAVVQFGCDSVRDTLHKSPEGDWAMTEFDRAVKQLRPEGERVKAEFDRYAKMADELRKNHENDLPLDEKGVRDLLKRVGIGPTPAAPRPGAPSQTPSPSPPKPFPVPVYSEGYRWPLEAGIVSAEFGQKRGNTHHQGIDIAAELRVPVYAAGPGEVIYAGDKLSGYGNVVILRHDQNTTTLYGHNSELKVRTGQEVQADQVVALLGSTGHSTGPHVHFEIRQHEKADNPRKYLPNSRF